MDLLLPGYFHSNRMLAEGRSSQAAAAMLRVYRVGQSPPLLEMPSAVCDSTDWCRRRMAADTDALARTAAIFSQAYPTSAFDGEQQRKLKSRDAARTRRTNENQEFSELTKLLPIPAAITGQLDKASVIRLTTSYLQLRTFCRDVLLPRADNPQVQLSACRPKGLSELEFEVNHDAHLLQALDGFAFVLSQDSRFLYVSETVSVYLGLSQAEMTGRRIFDYTYEQDQLELAKQLDLTPPKVPKQSLLNKSRTDDVKTSSITRHSFSVTADSETTQGNDVQSRDTNRCFCVRLKSNLTRRGTHQRCLGFKMVQITAKLKYRESKSDEGQQLFGVVGLVLPLPSPTINELFVDSDMFISRLTISLTVTFCEARISRITNLSSEELLNRSLYHMCHALDGRKLRRAHYDLLRKGQTVTEYYRLMSGAGGYVWLQTCATLIHNDKKKDEQSVIAMNYVLGCAGSINKLDAKRVFGEEEYKTSPREERRQSPAPSFNRCLNTEKSAAEEQGEESAERLSRSKKRHLDDNWSVERMQTTCSSSVNRGETNAPKSINESSCVRQGFVREKPIEEDVSHQNNRMTTSRDNSGVGIVVHEISQDWTATTQDRMVRKVYRPWKRMRPNEQIQESTQEY